MNIFDSSTLLAVNSYAGQSAWFDALMHGFMNNYLIKTAPLIMMLYWGWFKEESTSTATKEKRARILSSFAAAALAPIVARCIAMALPMRPRPFQEPELHFTLPLYMKLSEAKIIDWSSFPSDNVAVLFALVAGVFICSRRLGWLALLIAAVASFARIYSGIHHPTDVVAGGLLGLGIFLLIDRTPIKALLTRPLFRIMEKNPPIFYALFFIVTDQIAHLFWDSFLILNYIFHGPVLQ